jgi:predicted metal-dependent enzyme (double-stranded beta helix superfamily)
VFDVDSFIGDCIEALDEPRPQLAVSELLERAMSQPAALRDALTPERAELTPLYRSDALTVVHVVWAPSMTLPPHDHRMWAAIGIYQGAETNAFWRRRADGLVPAGGRELSEADVLLLGRDAVHSVVNPLAHAYTGAVHIYGGDFMETPRSMWDPDTMEEQRADGETVQRLFRQAEAARERID